MRKCLFFVTALLVALCASRTASAHVLVQDDTHRVGAVLHITPDDDPVAGQPAQLFYDVKDKLFLDNVFLPVLRIADVNGNKTEEVRVTHSGTTISATYTFPVQGVYDLTLTLSSPDKTYTFTYTQRVGRGTQAIATAHPDHAWADTAFIASICGGIALLVIGFNHRKHIKVNRKL